MADDNADSEQSSDFDSDFEGWDDETTLVSKLQEKYVLYGLQWQLLFTFIYPFTPLAHRSLANMKDSRH